ncbi:hypothetical protein [Amycolatopsis sp. NPDC003731]
MKRKLVFAGSLAAVALAVSACAGATKESAPDPTPAQIQMVPPHQVVGLPNGFRNVAEVCDDGGNMLVVTSRGSDFAGGQNGGGLASGIAVIPDDPRCKPSK